MQSEVVRAETTGSTIRSESVPKTSLRLAVGLVAFAAIANVVGAIYFWPIASSMNQYVLCAVDGCLLAQPALIAVWWTLGRQPLVRRTCISLAAFSVLFFSYTIAINSVNNSAEIYLPVFFLAVALGIFVLVAFPHWILGRTRSIRISSRHHEQLRDPNFTFNVSRLFFVTAIAACLCAIYPFVFPAMSIQPNLPVPWRSVIEFVLLFIVLLSGTSLLATLSVFNGRRSVWVLAFLFLLLVPQIAMEILINYSASVFGPITISRMEMVCHIYAFLIAFFSVSFTVLYVFRSIGYRFERA